MITPPFGLTATERVLPKLALDFTTASLDARVTLTRALNTATCVNSAGNVAVVNADLPRFDYDPTTLVCKGLLIEESRINTITNNTMVGAAAGSPGTPPTGWFPSSTGGALTRTIVGVGVENGISYIDIRYQSSGAATASIQFEGGNVTSASNGQTWTHSGYVKLVGGSLTNVVVYNSLIENDSSGNFVAGANGSSYIPTSASLISQRRAFTRTNTNAATAYVYSRTAVVFSGVGDVTLRVGLPQLELGAFATSVIQTSSAAVTRNADVATMTGANFSDWWFATEGGAVIQATPKAISGTLPAIAFDDNTANESIVLRGVSADPQLYVVDGGAAQATLDAGTLTSNTSYKLGGAWKASSFATSINGNAAVSQASGTLPTVTQARLGSDGSNYLNGWLQNLRYWPQRITNAEIQAFSK